MESDFKIAVIGLGIIGGSVAYALRGFHGAKIVGCDINPKTRKDALDKGAVSEIYENPADAIDGADLVVLAAYPAAIVETVEKNRGMFKKGSVVTDICGVKTAISKRIRDALPQDVDYVGGHPMAGKEVDGFVNASPELFWACGYIITPTDSSKPESVELIREMAKYMGSTRITVSSPEVHDSVIAYTSDLMHIAASALCLDYNENMNRAYTAGAFRDCTRVALINPQLWTELFLANAEHTVAETDRFINSLLEIRNAIADGDEKRLCGLLERVRQNKIDMIKKEPENYHEKATS